REGRAGAEGGSNIQAASMIRYNTITNGQSQTGSLADIFRREEWIENLVEIFERNSNSGVFDLDQHAHSGLRCAQRQGSAIGHRIDRVGCQSDHGLLQLADIAEHRRQIVNRLDLDAHVITTLLVSD